MHFILTGFTQDLGFRVFSFEKVEETRARSIYTVRADLALSRRYDIRMQELPLLCRLLLERCDTTSDLRTLTLTEEDMSHHATKVANRTPRSSHKRPGEVATGISGSEDESSGG